MCFPNDLIKFNPCRMGLDSFRANALKTTMLCQWKEQLSGGSFNCDLQSMLTASKCLYGLSEFAMKAIQTQLLCDILTIYKTIDLSIRGQGLAEDILGQGGEQILQQ